MKLTIVVPRYKEQFDVCHYLLDSLAIQRGCDLNEFEVLICNDGQDELKIPREYPFKIRQLCLEHRGVSATRNSGMDAAETPYIMFCDADDMFLNNYGLHLVFNSIEKDPDIIVPAFVEEQPHDGKWVIIQHQNDDCTFVHGKVWKKQFLVDNNHRFDESLTIHEDGYFVCIAMTIAKKIERITTPYYLWRWNETSVVRHDHDAFVLKTYKNVIDSRLAISKGLKERNLEKEFNTAVAKTITDCYYDFQFGDFRNPKYEPYAKKAAAEVRRYWNVYKEDFKKIPEPMIAECVHISRVNAYKKGFKLEKETLKNFINRVCEGKP